MLKQMTEGNIALRLNIGQEKLWMKVNVREIEEVVINLIANARDAMPQGGTISVGTSRVKVGPEFFRSKVSKSEALIAYDAGRKRRTL